MLLRSIYVMEVSIRPYYRVRREKRAGEPSVSLADKAEQKRRDDRDREILRRMWWMVATGLTAFLGGFAVWNLDNEYCSQIKRWRHDVGLPWGILLEGHGWWHLGTGFGAVSFAHWRVVGETMLTHYSTVLLYCLGHLVATLPQRPTRRFRVGLAAHILRSCRCEARTSAFEQPCQEDHIDCFRILDRNPTFLGFYVETYIHLEIMGSLRHGSAIDVDVCGDESVLGQQSLQCYRIASVASRRNCSN